MITLVVSCVYSSFRWSELSFKKSTQMSTSEPCLQSFDNLTNAQSNPFRIVGLFIIFLGVSWRVNPPAAFMVTGYGLFPNLDAEYLNVCWWIPINHWKNAELQALQAINNCSAQALFFLSPTTEPVDGDSFFPENHPMLIQCYPGNSTCQHGNRKPTFRLLSH